MVGRNRLEGPFTADEVVHRLQIALWDAQVQLQLEAQGARDARLRAYAWRQRLLPAIVCAFLVGLIVARLRWGP